MRARDTAAGWGWVARLLHWVMAALILFQLGLGVWMVNGTADLIRRFELTQTHKSWGVVILALALLRLAWRLTGRTHPSLPPGTPGWQVRAARASHAGLYVLMLLLPVSGWVMAAASPNQDLLGIDNTAFGTVVLPDPWQPGVESIATAARAVHLSGAAVIAALLALHVAAALRHHLSDRDRVLARMIFGR